MPNAPQVFHDKQEKTKNFVAYPAELFSAINQLCNGNEAKVLLTLLGCKGDGSFAPSTAYVQRMAGISQPSNYYKIRSQLEKKGLIQIEEDGNIHINTKRIVAKARQTNQEKEPKPKKEKEPPDPAQAQASYTSQ